MTNNSPHDLTLLLQGWCRGDRAALDKLIPLVYSELRRLAHIYMVRERPGHVLQTTALINEAYLRLIQAGSVEWQNRTHFFAIAANLMRRIAGKIGAGGMGEVYRAHDGRLKRDVAVKVLPDIFADDPERLARFDREACLLASVNHPNIAAIHGLEPTDSGPVLVMELVEGDTLAQRIAKGPLPVEEALDICRQIAEGLEAAHEKGVIHRDLKPANVKITPEGKVKILDFGLAKAFQAEAVATEQSPSISEVMTRAGVILGTAAYMSPEQAKGPYAAPRISVDGKRIVFTMWGLKQGVWVYDIARSTLSRLTEEGRPADAVWTPDGNRLVFDRHAPSTADLFWMPIDGSTPVETLLAGGNHKWQGSMHPYGTKLAYVETTADNTDIFLLDLRSRRAQPLLNSQFYEAFPDFSPDGHWLAYCSDESGREEVYVRPFPGPGGHWQVSHEGVVKRLGQGMGSSCSIDGGTSFGSWMSEPMRASPPAGPAYCSTSPSTFRRIRSARLMCRPTASDS